MAIAGRIALLATLRAVLGEPYVAGATTTPSSVSFGLRASASASARLHLPTRCARSAAARSSGRLKEEEVGGCGRWRGRGDCWRRSGEAGRRRGEKLDAAGRCGAVGRGFGGGKGEEQEVGDDAVRVGPATRVARTSRRLRDVRPPRNLIIFQTTTIEERRQRV
jgi:hypothetical protein